MRFAYWSETGAITTLGQKIAELTGSFTTLVLQDPLLQVVILLGVASGATMILSWRVSVGERRADGITVADWKRKGFYEMGTAGLILPLLGAISVVMVAMFFGYVELSSDPKASGDYLSFAAPSLGAMFGVGAFINEVPWFKTHVMSDKAFVCLFLSLMTIPFGYIGYLVSHPINGLMLWNLKATLGAMWLPILAGIASDVRRNRPSDFLFLGACALGILSSEIFILSA